MKDLQAYARALARKSGKSVLSGEVFAKILTPNEDSGHHGVAIPVNAYTFFPYLDIPDPKQNASKELPFFDSIKGQQVLVSYKYYQRYPERRITCLNRLLNTRSAKYRLLVVLKIRQRDGTFEYLYDATTSRNHWKFKRLFGLTFGGELRPDFGRFIVRSLDSQKYSPDAALLELLKKFDRIARKGWINSLRKGDTGIGYTFETLIGIKENNERIADFKGIEIKCKGIKEGGSPGEGKVNLFQAGPIWIDGLSTKKRLRTLGSQGKDGLYRCHAQVTTRANRLGLKLEMMNKDRRILLRKVDVVPGYWPFRLLQKRLSEKHSRAVFIKAKVRKGPTSKFKYEEVVYCEAPRIERFLKLVSDRRIVFEFLMSETGDGKVRNRGYPWRLVREQFLEDLFSFKIKLR